jgi:hypothetical protein
MRIAVPTPVRVAVPTLVRIAALLLASVAVLAPSCASGAGSRVAAGEIPPNLAGLLPTPAQLQGWTIDEGPALYTSEDLFEYMDGGAERYLGYGFRALAHVRYCLRGEPAACVTLDVFDMGSDLGAFGIYRSALSSSAVQRSWGAEGNRSGTIASGWRSTIFVHAEAEDDRPALIGTMESLVATGCAGASHAQPAGSTLDKATASGRGLLPAILDPLPDAGLIPLSERYVVSDLLGFSFLPGGVLASYDLDGRTAELFFSDTGSDSAAIGAIARLRAHHAKRGSLVRSLPDRVGPGLRFSESPQGTGTVAAHARYVTGVRGELSYREQERLLTHLHERLDRTEQRK